jgi:dye decolorizing peroxidase
MANNRITRRGLFAFSGAAIVGGAGGYALASVGAQESPGVSQVLTKSPRSSAHITTPFYGVHQVGVDTPPQVYTKFLGLNVNESNKDSLEAIGRILTDDAARLMRGEGILGDTEPEISANPARLGVTLGLSRVFIEELGVSVPASFPVIPAFRTDALDERWGQSDLVVQIGSDDPLTLSHVQRMITRDLSTLTTTMWVQSGFLSPTPASDGGDASRNQMGQVDGTVNPTLDQYSQAVWIDDGSWAEGGTVLVLRRIRMLMDDWDILDRSAKEIVVGRSIETGAPLGGQKETDPVDFTAVDTRGLPVIPLNAHIRVAHAQTPEEMILRRPYNYNVELSDGQIDMGLLFAAYTKDPAKSFIPMQERVARSDAMNKWVTTIGSAAYLILPGVIDGKFLGEGLL